MLNDDFSHFQSCNIPCLSMSEVGSTIKGEVKSFVTESTHFLRRCTKPDKREYVKVAQAVAVGFCLMGGIGYLIQLIHIPIRKIIVGL